MNMRQVGAFLQMLKIRISHSCLHFKFKYECFITLGSILCMIRLLLHWPTPNRLTRLSRAVYMTGCLCYYSKWNETISDVVHNSVILFSHQTFLQIWYNIVYNIHRCFVCKLHRYFRIEVTQLCVQHLSKCTGRVSYYVHVSNMSII